MLPRFSGRVPATLDPNAQGAELALRRAAGSDILDLTLSNPTRCGLEQPVDWPGLLRAREILDYDPQPQGSLKAREAIAALYSERGESVDPADLFLTAGTSEGYSHLFRLLCDPGHTLLFPQPSYPLLESLAQLESLAVSHYRLVRGDPDAAGTPWRLDRDSLLSAPPTSRALCCVLPNNPTGSLLDPEDAAWLAGFASERGLALIVDEVFSGYLRPGVLSQRPEGESVFILDGVSKLLGLPQLKVAWIRLAGEAAWKTEARQRLDWISDAYLSVGPSQHSLPSLLARKEEFQEPIRRWIEENLASARQTRQARPLWPQGGWSLPLRCPGISDDETFAVSLLREEGLLVHPGYLFDCEEEDIIVVSLLVPPPAFREGLARLERRLEAHGR